MQLRCTKNPTKFIRYEILTASVRPRTEEDDGIILPFEAFKRSSRPKQWLVSLPSFIAGGKHTHPVDHEGLQERLKAITEGNEITHRFDCK